LHRNHSILKIHALFWCNGAFAFQVGIRQEVIFIFQVTHLAEQARKITSCAYLTRAYSVWPHIFFYSLHPLGSIEYQRNQ